MIRFFKRKIPKVIGSGTDRTAEETQKEKVTSTDAGFGADVITERLPVRPFPVTERNPMSALDMTTLPKEEEEERCFSIEYEITFIHTNEEIS